MPRGFDRVGRTASATIEIRALIQSQAIFIRDINLYHKNWDNRTIHLLQPANKLTNWVTKNGAIYELQPGTKAHNRRSTIDVVISSTLISSNITECYTKLDLYTTSNHKTIITTLGLRLAFCKEKKKRNCSKKNWTRKYF